MTVSGLPIWSSGSETEGVAEVSDDETRTGDGSSLPPRLVGADPVPDLSLPRTVLSSVESLIQTEGVIQSSHDNLTLYNSGITMRLLGGPRPHDELVAQGGMTISSYSFWGVEAEGGSGWIPLSPTSSEFTIIGTNTTGAFLARTMRVSAGPYSGQFRIVYKAQSSGPLKWDLEFTANTDGQYRLVYSWLNISDVFQLMPGPRQFLVSYPDGNYTLDWSDIPLDFSSTTNLVPEGFLLHVNLGNMAAGSRILIDPSLVASGVQSVATAHTFQRKVFYEPVGGYYWTFYYDKTTFNFSYRNSPDGIQWSSSQSVPSGVNCPCTTWTLPAVLNYGEKVVVVRGQSTTVTGPSPHSFSASLPYTVGTISGASIGWGPVQSADTITRTCDNGNPGTSCEATIYLRYVNAALSSTGQHVFSYNLYDYGPGPGVCSTLSTESAALVVYNGNRLWASCTAGSSDSKRSVVLPSSSQGQVRVLYQTSVFPNVQLQSRWFDGVSAGTVEIVESNVLDTSEFSAVADTDFGTHVVYRGTGGVITYAYLASSASSWAYSSNIFGGPVAYPTVTVDLSTNNIYAMAISGTSIAMRSKTLFGSWSDSSIAYPVIQRVNPAHLGSNFASASATNASKVLIVWTEGSTNPYSVVFGSIPIQTVWSPYSSPTSPWDGNGLAPYGQYFANLDEYVSPITGMLTVRQTDLSVPGRGLNLEITRVYTEPFSFLSGSPYDLEVYPWAPLGNGWQLNFPWLRNVVNPSYIHLWDGQGYRIPSSFWIGATTVFENHRGEHFRLVRNTTGIFLYAKSGAFYTFDPSNSNRLTNITDPTGGNFMSFTYDGSNHISKITDSVLRTFLFCYTGGLLSSIDQAGGTCGSETGFVRRVSYGYSGQTLVSATDPAGRVTSYRYEAVSDVNVRAWLLSRITYTTQWYSNYTYRPATLGTQAASFRVFQQLVSSPTDSTRRFDYTYSQLSGGERVTNSTIQTFEGLSGSLQSAGFTRFSFSFSGITMNSTDATNRLLQGFQQRFGVQGEVPREIVLVTAENSWYWTKGTPASGWNSLPAFVMDSSWNIAPSAYEYDKPYPPWGPICQPTCFQDTQAKWIWWNADADTSSTDEPVWFRTVITVPVTTTYTIEITADDTYTLYVDGVSRGTDATWQTRETYSVTLDPGKRVVAVAADNTGGGNPAGLLLSMRKSTGGVIVRTDDTIGSYSNYYRYDLWGNMIYSRRAINPSAAWYHEIFHTYYNSGLSPGFYSFQETFSQSQGAGPDNTWSVQNGHWVAKNGLYNGTQISGRHESIFAWSDIAKADVSVQSNVYISRLVNTTAADSHRVGIFAHHSSGNYKWALVLHEIGSSTYLELLDELNAWLGDSQPSARVSCSLTTGIWYSFNLTIRGYSASGWSSAPGVGTCTVSGVFSTSSPAAGGTAYGLYAGDYATSFDNVIVSTVNPYITGSGFSNSFTNTPPGPNVHNSLAGAAELSNSTGTVQPTESYFGYNTWGGLTQTKQRYDPVSGPVQWLTTSRTYDNFGNLARLTDPLGNFTDHSFSSTYNFAYLTSQTHTLVPGDTQLSTQYSYNFTTGNVQSVTDPKGNATSYQNDSLGRVKRINYPLGAFVQYTYNDQANYVDITNENGWKIRYIYDGLARLIIEDRFLGGASYSNETLAYSWQDMVVSRTDPFGNIARYQYDATGRMVNMTRPNGKSILQTYNDLASWVRTTDQDGNYKCATYDRLDRLVSVVEEATGDCGSGVVTNYYYDEVGSLTGVTNALAKSTTYTYDNLGRLTGTTFADNTTESYEYDNNGNLVRKVDQNDVKTLYAYDSLDRVKTITYCRTSAVTSISYTYDKNGNLLTLRNENATITYAYDARDRVLREKYEVNLPTRQVVDLGCFGPGGISNVSGGLEKTYTVKYTYNGEVLETVEYPTLSITNIAVKFSYDSLGRILNVTKSGTSTYYARFFTYYKNDQLKGLQFGNGLVGNYTYDSLSRPSSITLKNGGNTILSLSYAYNNTGTVASVTGQVNGVTANEQFRYDALQRLSNATVTSQGTTTTLWYEYDSVGNRLRQKLNSAWTTYTYNQTNNRLNSYSQPGLNLAYTYNNDGTLNTRTITTNSTTWAYTWNVPGHLLKVTRNGANQGRYAYDGMGRMVESVESTTDFLAYMGTETLFKNIYSVHSIDYLYAGPLRIATVDSSTGSYDTVKYFHVDHLGSTRLVTSSTASVLFADSYQPFGQDNGSPTGSETYKFTGKSRSGGTGLYYYYQRWYDPEIGRFASADILPGFASHPQTLNRYGYVANSPTSLVDPTGLNADSTHWICVDFCGYPTDTTPQQMAAILAGADIQGLLGFSPTFLASRWRPVRPSSYCRNCHDTGTTVTTRTASPQPATVKTTIRIRTEGPAESIGIDAYQYAPYSGYRTRFATPTKYATSAEARARLSLPGHNDATFVRSVHIPKGTPVRIGTVPANPLRPGTGGGLEIEVLSSRVFVGGEWTFVMQRLLGLRALPLLPW